MHLGTLRYARCLGLVALALALTCLPLTACGSSGGGGGGEEPPPPTPQPRLVKADPAGQTFDSSLSVKLMVEGDDSAGAKIYYTDDLSPLINEDGTLTGNGMEYTAELTLTDDTVVKFYAEWADGTTTEAVWEGYVNASPGSIKEAIAKSGHGQIAAEAWRHWDADDPALVSDGCAKCHSPGGFLEWAADEAVTAQPLPFGLLECTACHGPAGGTFPSIYAATDSLLTYTNLEPVEFPSGDEVSLFESSNICMGCHSGRKSGLDVDDKLAGDAPWGFQNVHYYAAAASLWGEAVNGGYEYAGEEYVNRNTFPSHPEGLNTCVGCHMGTGVPHDHDFMPAVADCSGCHGGTSFQTLGGSPGANYLAIQGALPETLTAIQAVAATLPSGPIVYDSHHYPYWFPEGAEPTFPNQYKFGVDPNDAMYVPTPDDEALYKACYNYQFGLKEPGGYIHNGTYLRQILHDAIVDLGATPTDVPPGRPGYVSPTDMFVAKTEQFILSGHAHVAGEAFRHWDADYDSTFPPYNPNDPVEVPTSCARCHTTWGYVDWAADNTVDEPANVLTVVGCVACHKQANLYETPGGAETRYDDLGTNTALSTVTFPSGDTATMNDASNICMGCHQGRAWGGSVDGEINNTTPPITPWNFQNVHYYAAAASLFGADVQGGYEYGTNPYQGATPWNSLHQSGGLDTCVGCHLRGTADHSFLPLVSDCSGCHAGSDFEDLAGSPGINYSTITTLLTELYTAIQLKAAPMPSGPIEYNDHAYPYWFPPGLTDPGYGDRYLFAVDLSLMNPTDHTPNADDEALFRACYNYQFAKKDPAGYIHNGKYVGQLLYDSIVDLGGSPTPARPPVTTP